VTGSSASQVLLVLPVGIPWVLAAVLALLDGRRRWVGLLAAAGLGASLVSLVWLAIVVVREGPMEMVAGGWPENVGVTLRADPLGATFALVSAGVILVSLLYELSLGVRWRVFPALVLLVAAGLTGLFLTGDVFNVYVFFEISMTASFILTGYREEDYQVRGAFIFSVVNLLGSVVFLTGIAALYSISGSLDMQTIAERTDILEPSSVIAVAALILAAFCLKLGLFPFHFWLPAVYVGSHAPMAAILSGALANIGSYGLLRFGGGILPRELEFGSTAVLVLGTASILYGALQAISRRDTSEVMAYSAIGQVGYVLLALGIGGARGVRGGRTLLGRELAEQGGGLPRGRAARAVGRGGVRRRRLQHRGRAPGRRVRRQDSDLQSCHRGGFPTCEPGPRRPDLPRRSAVFPVFVPGLPAPVHEAEEGGQAEPAVGTLPRRRPSGPRGAPGTLARAARLF
jgi:multicomponent Na+:H+ antiporter subunit D